eukprot:scaffold425_cov175-Amphora_coffeaeformis.AAC.19
MQILFFVGGVVGVVGSQRSTLCGEANTPQGINPRLTRGTNPKSEVNWHTRILYLVGHRNYHIIPS